MKTMEITKVSTYANWGLACEQNLVFALSGEMVTHDSVPFDKGSDYEPLNLSIKSERFTLVSGRTMKATTKDGQIEEYFNRTHSTMFAYVAKDDTAYFMNANEFRQFLENFTTIQRDSEKNGGYFKLRMRSESKAVMAWLRGETL